MNLIQYIDNNIFLLKSIFLDSQVIKLLISLTLFISLTPWAMTTKYKENEKIQESGILCKSNQI